MSRISGSCAILWSRAARDLSGRVRVRELNIPESVHWRAVLQAHYRVALTDLGWIRASHVSRDRAYLWLRGQGEPRSAMEIAKAAGTSEHATRENMRRDDAFAQVRPKGTWALADWRLDGADKRYSNAVEVVVEVLRELGPLDYNGLRAECQRRYPVSEWRIKHSTKAASELWPVFRGGNDGESQRARGEDTFCRFRACLGGISLPAVSASGLGWMGCRAASGARAARRPCAPGRLATGEIPGSVVAG
jgi:hypothetical protein